jgi:hypothetical protein
MSAEDGKIDQAILDGIDEVLSMLDEHCGKVLQPELHLFVSIDALRRLGAN